MRDSSEALPPPLPEPNHASALEEVRDRAETVRVGNGARIGPAKAVVLEGVGGRVAILEGYRTPFEKPGGALRTMDVVDLATVAAREVVSRSGIDPERIDRSIFGAVAPAPNAPNLGREVILRASLPPTIPGSSVSLTCASSARALVFGVQSILTGESTVVLTGGAESLSNIPVRLGRNAARRVTELEKTKSVKAKLAVLSKLRIRDLAPVIPSIAEYSTGLTMGAVCERMAQENDISRRAQDEITLASHERAWAAQEAGCFRDQIVPTLPRKTRSKEPEFLLRDGAVRRDTSMAALGALPPAFDESYGTLTAGNSAPMADGGAALLLMSEEAAEGSSREPLGFLKSFSFVAMDLSRQPLQGPVYAIAEALDRAGLSLQEMDLVELHEAFGAQVLSNLKALASRRFALEELGREEPMGQVDFERLNVNGGTLALGHPFGATGARLVLQLLRELQRRDLSRGLVAGCAAGGVGYALVLERP